MLSPGWLVVVAGFMILMVSWGSQLAFSVFLVPLTQEFGWDRASTAGVFSLSILIFGVGSIFAGQLTDRWGPRLVVGMGGIFLGGGFLLSALIQNLWQFYLFYGVLTGMGVSVGWGPLVATVSRWFSERRGLAMGVMSIGISLGILLIPYISSRLISAFGWRISFLLLGTITGAVIFGATLLISSESPDKVPSFSRKNSSFSMAGNLGPATSPLPGPSEWTLSRALGTRTFWMIFSAYLLWCNGFYMVSVHLAAYGIDSGFTPTQAALAVSLIGGGSIFGKILMGLLSDRIGPQKVLAINIFLQGVCIFGLLGFRSMTSLYLFSTLFGFGYGGTGPQLPVVTAKFFGISSLGAIFGVLILSGQVGGALGPLLAGMIYDLSQNYFYGFLLGGVSILVSFGLMSFLKFPRAIYP